MTAQEAINQADSKAYQTGKPHAICSGRDGFVVVPAYPSRLMHRRVIEVCHPPGDRIKSIMRDLD